MFSVIAVEPVLRCNCCCAIVGWCCCCSCDLPNSQASSNLGAWNSVRNCAHLGTRVSLAMALSPVKIPKPLRESQIDSEKQRQRNTETGRDRERTKHRQEETEKERNIDRGRLSSHRGMMMNWFGMLQLLA